MARGWESKSIESQQEDRVQSRANARTPLTPEAVERARLRATLRLQRARVADELARTTADVRRRALESALAHLDDRLQALGPE
jgi:hypothetical protein